MRTQERTPIKSIAIEPVIAKMGTRGTATMPAAVTEIAEMVVTRQIPKRKTAMIGNGPGDSVGDDSF